jgi:hypothetical protein
LDESVKLHIAPQTNSSKWKINLYRSLKMSPEQIVEATLYTIKEAINSPEVSTADWKNRFMAELVEEIRALKANGLPRIEGKNS